MAGELAGKVVIFTGAAGGQGRVAAPLLAAAGARLVLTDIDERGAAVAGEIGSEALFVAHDVSDRAAWDRVVECAVETFGGVDVLVNNAGVAGRDDVQSLSAERLGHYLDVNLIGALNGMQAVLPAMRARGGGAIVNIASISALASTPGLAGYGISKWALRGLSRYAAAELAADKVRVNLVLPGALDVSMIKDAAASPGKSSFSERVPLRRVATSDEIARVVIFLASDAASYVTGAELTVDGGYSA
ncbi:SDR family NAD(P)-dependent oxidoreductase [Terricaulis sp.]|uniref:SDR family NAD(P)-dependent oxidoreductase n=1 Tax=Terricaulis sp. TaxID=2768686 RepID=UPI00378505E3